MTEIVEGLAKLLFEQHHGGKLHGWSSATEAFWKERARAALAYLAEHGPSEAMWAGLARQIMMWVDFGQPTPRRLFSHLKSSGYDIPDWLRNEAEMQALDHVVSKGTRCVLIFRAMLAAAGKEG